MMSHEPITLPAPSTAMQGSGVSAICSFGVSDPSRKPTMIVVTMPPKIDEARMARNRFITPDIAAIGEFSKAATSWR